MNTRRRRLVGVVLLAALMGVAADWPAFRGPRQLGVSDEQGLPVKWGPQENVIWKTKLPGSGASSPITWGDRVFVTCWTGYADGKGQEAKLADLRRLLVCLERKSGAILWQQAVPALLPESEYVGQIAQHGYATSTPATDGERVYVFFGRTGVLAFDFAGKQLWHTEVGKMLNGWGTAASPVLYRDLVLVNATVESGALLALDRATGKEKWRTKLQGDSWATPLLVAVPGGKTEVVLSAQVGLVGLDPDSGKQLWECDTGILTNPSSTPVVRDGVVYLMGASFNGRSFLAVRAGGQGDVTKTHVVWKREKAGASYCSPVLVGDHLYYASALFCCVRADNGQVVFDERLAGLGQEYSSPVAAEGRLYLFTRKGTAHVLAATGRFEQLAQNELGDASGFTASPAVSGGLLLVRSNEYIYCLGAKK